MRNQEKSLKNYKKHILSGRRKFLSPPPLSVKKVVPTRDLLSHLLPVARTLRGELPHRAPGEECPHVWRPRLPHHLELHGQAAAEGPLVHEGDRALEVVVQLRLGGGGARQLGKWRGGETK